MPLKLGSNWKSVGIGTDMRRLAPGNSRINFGFCKGDDNFGGRKRKELDDFLKSLGKQMTLKMYRLEDTERVRMKLREDRRREVRERAEREEREETLKEERLERNQRWRERRSGGSERISSEETEAVSEEEERRLKNREWRQRREERRRREEAGVVSEDYCHLSPPRLEHQILRELLCGLCQEELGPPGQIYQCEEGHNLCGDCRARPDLKECPQCFSQFSGRNFALERLAATLFSHSGLGKEGGVQEYVSRSFVFATSQDVINEGRRDTSEDISDIESILLDTEGETLRIK